MIQCVYLFVILVGSIITTNVADPTPAKDGQEHYSTKKIFKPPSDSDVSQISGTSTPWVIPDLIPTIKEFKKNVFEDLKSSPAVQKIWDMKTKSKETRAIYFKILNKNLNDLGHPAPAALANIVSKSGSLFKKLKMAVYFKAAAIHLAEFFLSKDIKIERDTAKRFVDSISKALEAADSNNKESVWQAILDGYINYITSYGFKVIDVVDELKELFTSQLIVLHDK